MGAVIESAVNWAVKIANDNSHGYDQNSRWGPNYDCSSLVISAFEQAGCKVKSGGATYTGNMKSVFLRYGFSDVTSKIALSTGLGLKRGDVLLNTTHHTALVVEDNGRTIVNASINEKGKTTGGKSGDQTGREIYTRGYYNYPWNVVLRYNESSSTATSEATSTKEDKDYSLSDSFGTGGNIVADKFSASVHETYKLIVGGNDITSYIGNLSWQNSISDILSDILEKCGRGFNFDMTPNGIRIYKYGAIYAYPEFRITPNTHLIYSPTLKGSVSHALSIEDMKNSVKVVTESDKVYTVKAVAKDSESIYKYGVLQEVLKIEEKDGDADTYVKNKLSELNKVKESFSIEIIEAINSYTCAGSMITVDDVNYLIESTDHSIKNGVHYVKLGLRKFG